MNDAFKRGDYEEYHSLHATRNELATFQPVMMHSYAENTVPVPFHQQILRDFATVEKLGFKMLEELEAHSAS